jgi:triosephosphate isomerase
MYFGHQQSLDWCAEVAKLARHGLPQGVELFVMPSFPALVPAQRLLHGTSVSVGAQDVHWEDSGAFTGEVSPLELRDIGCTHVEVGHAERRRYFGENDDMVTAKTHAALRNGLVPVICIGETKRQPATIAAESCIKQLASALGSQQEFVAAGEARIVVAYEPIWAIGAAAPAPNAHIGTVCSALKQWLSDSGMSATSTVIYGGSAGPGLLARLGASTDGLFLGRFAHDVSALNDIIREAAERPIHAA